MGVSVKAKSGDANRRLRYCTKRAQQNGQFATRSETDRRAGRATLPPARTGRLPDAAERICIQSTPPSAARGPEAQPTTQPSEGNLRRRRRICKWPPPQKSASGNRLRSGRSVRRRPLLQLADQGIRKASRSPPPHEPGQIAHSGGSEATRGASLPGATATSESAGQPVSSSATHTGGHLSSTEPPAASISCLIFSASSLGTPSLIGFGALSTNSLASFRPRPVSARTTLITAILLSP